MVSSIRQQRPAIRKATFDVFNEAGTTSILDRYAVQIADDLQRNQEERETVRSQIADLQTRRKQLEVECEWLSTMRDALAGSIPALDEEPSAAPEAKARSLREILAAMKSAEAGPHAFLQSLQEKGWGDTPTSDQQSGTPQFQPFDEVISRNAPTKRRGPYLHELVYSLLTREPQTVSELTRELLQAHPERRGTKTQVVRNTLENLVAKSLAVRTKRATAVFYTMPPKENDEAASAAVPDSVAKNAAPEAEQEMTTAI
ncbi:hypothetical protein ACIOWI_36600 [Streptomyces sp. NPDC087659]|uniref:hypothetical protein n=1 Tax=Streptomyces sp. NPDC087659 TaxID=3365801 RepID=UPI003805DFE8